MLMVAAIQVHVSIDQFQLCNIPAADQAKVKESLTKLFTRLPAGIADVAFESCPYNTLLGITLKPPADGCFSIGESEMIERTTSKAMRAEISKAIHVERGRVCKPLVKVQRVAP